MKSITRALVIFLLGGTLIVFGCASAPKKTLELTQVTEEQVGELQKSHIQFVQLYYKKLKSDVNEFIDRRWIPVFLSKAVQNEKFRADLDNAYLVSNIDPSEVRVTWRGGPLPEPQKRAIVEGIEKSISDQRGRLGQVLLDFSEEAQRQIIGKRRKLLRPVEDQERMVIREINASYADLQGAQAALKAYLSSLVELKESQELVLKKLGALKRSEEIMNAALGANETLSVILQEKENTEEAVRIFLEQMKKSEKRIKNQVSNAESDEKTKSE